MTKFLQLRIGDPRIIRLIQRMLKGGILEDGLVKASEKGTPQGSILLTAKLAFSIPRLKLSFPLK